MHTSHTHTHTQDKLVKVCDYREQDIKEFSCQLQILQQEKGELQASAMEVVMTTGILNTNIELSTDTYNCRGTLCNMNCLPCKLCLDKRYRHWRCRPFSVRTSCRQAYNA